MAQDPGLAFAQNLVNRYMQFKAEQFKIELYNRREQRYERSLEENRLYRRETLDIQRQRLATPFTRGKIETSIGVLKSGGEKTLFGNVIAFKDQKARVNYMLRQLGEDWMEYAPEAVDIINQQSPEEPPLTAPTTPTSMFPPSPTPSPEMGLFDTTEEASTEIETPLEDETTVFESLTPKKAFGKTDVSGTEEEYIVDNYSMPEDKKVFDSTYSHIIDPREKQRYIDRFWRPEFGRSIK